MKAILFGLSTSHTKFEWEKCVIHRTSHILPCIGLRKQIKQSAWSVMTQKHTQWPHRHRNWSIFCWTTVVPGIHVDVNLTHTTFLKIVTHQVQNSVPQWKWPFQQNNVPCHTVLRNTRVQVVALVSKFPRSKSNLASVGCAGTNTFDPLHNRT